MLIKQKLDEAISKWAILNSRFYKAWQSGELPKSALFQYAVEYGNFIRLLPKGWDTLNDAETAEEEKEHVVMWDSFTNALDMQGTVQTTPAVATLKSVGDKLFSSPITALGAMYAFELQQPDTASTKLEGLRKYYPVSIEGEEYFIVHAANHHESQKLLVRMAELSSEHEDEIVLACEEMSKALWDALEGIYDTAVGNR